MKTANFWNFFDKIIFCPRFNSDAFQHGVLKVAFGLHVTFVVNEDQQENSLDPLVEDISDSKGVFVALGFAVIKNKVELGNFTKNWGGGNG